MRLFVGIPLTPTVVDELSKLATNLRSKEDNLRWAQPASWHITLQFLGATTQQQYDCLVQSLRELRSPHIPIRLQELDFFDRAGIFFADVKPAPALLVLQQRITAATGPCGFVPETRPYHPHITLARTTKEGTQALRILKARISTQPKFSVSMADSFALYESFTGPGGSRYEIRERFPLGS
jgi:2'-5' RNA ligase